LDAIEIFKEDISKSVVSFTRSNIHPEWCFRINKNEISPVTSWKESKKRSQDIDDTFELNGLIYLASPKFIRSNKSFLNSHTHALLIENEIETLDIDTENDFLHAEKIATKF
jgi:CMP-N-acetylneuraminic acid synthetase